MTMDAGVSYFGVRRPIHVATDMRILAADGFTYVVHTMTEHDLDNYRATMAEIVRVTHDAGLRVWLDPVAIGHLFGGTEFPSELAQLRPELAQRDDLGRVLPAACPTQPAVRARFREWIDVAAEAGADTLFWDEPHLWIGSWYDQPERTACYCDGCRAAFVAAHGAPIPTDPRDPTVISFRREQLLDLLRELLAYGHDTGRRNAVTVLPTEIDAEAGIGMEAVAGLGLIDDLGTDPYPFPAYDGQPDLGRTWPTFVQDHIDGLTQVAAARGLDTHLWVQGFSLPRDDHGYLAGVFDLVAAAGIHNVAIWGFDGHRDMSRFACADPDAAWATILAAIARLRGPG